MKKILIVSANMGVGGIQKSLLELLKALSNNKEYDISLFCCKKEGVFLERVPKSVRILDENPYARVPEQTIADCKKQGFKYYLLRAFSSMWSKVFTKAIPARMLCKRIGKIGDRYDIAISYSQPIGEHNFCNLTNEIALKCVEAATKITFIHCDFGSYGGNTKCNRALYRKFDRIAAVSDSVGARLVDIIPDIAEKIKTVYNFCDHEEIERLASADPVDYSKPTFVTVSRLSSEKGLLRCLPLFARLKDEGLDFEWHIIGGGPLKNAITEKILTLDLGEQVILEGEQLNPYRYMKNATYFLLPSYHEAAPIVFDEARALGIPMLTTKTLSAVEMVESNSLGTVCENDEEGIFNMLYLALKNELKPIVRSKQSIELCLKQFDDLCK